MIAFDPMATAIDWLDAYRANDLDSILNLYADDASIECACHGTKIVSGKPGLRAYWQQRLRDFPAKELTDLRLTTDGVEIFYSSPDGIVHAMLDFSAHRLIKS